MEQNDCGTPFFATADQRGGTAQEVCSRKLLMKSDRSAPAFERGRQKGTPFKML